MRSQFTILNPSAELKRLYDSYGESSIQGEYFMKAKDPPAALDYLEPWLNSHLEMNERHDAILAEIEKMKGE